MSPGPLPRGLNKEAVLSGTIRIRNYGINQILYCLKYIENYGAGLWRTVESYANYDKQPELIVQEDLVKVILPNSNYQKEAAAIKQILTLIEQKGSIKRIDIQKIWEYGDTKTKQYISGLIIKGTL